MVNFRSPDKKIYPDGEGGKMRDTPAYKLHRKDAPQTSVEAAYALQTTPMESIVLDCIGSLGQLGCIQDDVLRSLPDYAYSTVTARFKSLCEKGLIEYTGEKRKGRSGRNQRVMRKKI